MAARAQQPKIIRLGYLEPQRPTEAVATNLRRQFLLGLRDLGYVEGRHFKMEDRSANGQLERHEGDLVPLLVLIGAGVVLALDPTAQEQKKLTDEYEADVARSPGGRSPALQ